MAEAGQGLVSVKLSDGTELYMSPSDARKKGWEDGQIVDAINLVEGVVDFLHSEDLQDELDNADQARASLRDARETFYKLVKSGTTTGTEYLNALKDVDRAQEDLDEAQNRAMAIEIRNLRMQALAAGGKAILGTGGGGMMDGGASGMLGGALAGGVVGYFLGRDGRGDRRRRRELPAHRSTVPNV